MNTEDTKKVFPQFHVDIRAAQLAELSTTVEYTWKLSISAYVQYFATKNVVFTNMRNKNAVFTHFCDKNAVFTHFRDKNHVIVQFGNV